MTCQRSIAILHSPRHGPSPMWVEMTDVFIAYLRRNKLKISDHAHHDMWKYIQDPSGFLDVWDPNPYDMGYQDQLFRFGIQKFFIIPGRRPLNLSVLGFYRNFDLCGGYLNSGVLSWWGFVP